MDNSITARPIDPGVDNPLSVADNGDIEAAANFALIHGSIIGIRRHHLMLIQPMVLWSKGACTRSPRIGETEGAKQTCLKDAR